MYAIFQSGDKPYKSSSKMSLSSLEDKAVVNEEFTKDFDGDSLVIPNKRRGLGFTRSCVKPHVKRSKAIAARKARKRAHK